MRSVHPIAARYTLSPRQAVATSEQIQEDVTVFRKQGTQKFRMPMIGAPGGINSRGMSAAVTEQDGRERTAPRRAPELRTELEFTAPYHDRVRVSCVDLAADHHSHNEQEGY